MVLLGRTGRGNGAERVLAAAGDSRSVITLARCDAGSSEEAACALSLAFQVCLCLHWTT